MGKSCVAVRHVLFEDLGMWEETIAAAGFDIRHLETGIDSLDPAESADLTVFIGGPIGAYEDENYPFLRRECEIISRRMAERRPTLGICLGAQLIARASGAKVYPGTNGKELEWGPLILTDAGREGLLAPLAEEGTRVLNWHNDTFDLPEGATLLASSAGYPNQIYTIGDHVLGLQCHLEIDPDTFERWLVGHTLEIATTPGTDVPTLRRDTGLYGKEMARVGQRILGDWLGRAFPG